MSTYRKSKLKPVAELNRTREFRSEFKVDRYITDNLVLKQIAVKKIGYD